MKWLCASFLTLLLPVIHTARAADAAEPQVLLHVSFDANKRGTIDAQRAAGVGKGTFHPKGGRPKFVDGIRGRGLLTGGSFQSVSYPVEGNIKSDAGTLTFWLRGIDWQPLDRTRTEHFVRIGGKRGWVMVYSWIHFPVWLLVDSGGQRDKMQFPVGTPGEWNMFTVTWSGQRCAIYFNGLPVKKLDKFPLPKFQGSIVVGEHSTGDRKIVLDELMIHDRALSDAEVAALYHRVGDFFNDPFATVPRLAAPPKIDGKIAEAEWANAAAIAGLLDDAGYLARTQSTFLLGYDDALLYIACRSPIPERHKSHLDTTALHGLLRQTKTEHDVNVEADDSIEVDITPNWPFGRWHRLVVNHINTHYDYAVNPDKSIELAWNPTWTTATSLDANGWSVEIAIDLSSFPSQPKPGDIWGINLRRIWKQLQQQTDRWAWGNRVRATSKAFGYYGPVGRIRFARPGEPFARIDSVADLNAKKAGATVTLCNPGAARSFRVACRSNAGDVHDERTVAAKAKATATYRFKTTITDPASSHLDLQVTDGATPVLRCRLPFLQRQSLSVYCRHYPSFEKANVELDLSLLRDHPLATISARVVLRDAATKAVALSRTVDHFANYYPNVELATRDLKPGAYKLETEIRAAAKPVATDSQDFEKRPTPPWHGNRIGLSDGVPPPFTPIKVKGHDLACWGRRYRLADRLLPTSITTAGRELLAQPIGLDVKLADGKTLDSTKGKATFAFTGKPADARVAWSAEQKLGSLTLTTTCWLEYDGLLWTTLTITPKQATKLAHIRLDIPLRKDRVTLVNNYDYSVKTTGLLPAEGIRKGWMPLWLGDERGGLQWLTETNATWLLAKANRGVEAIPEADRVVLRVNLCDHEVTLSKPLTASFGIIATPTRPPTRGYLPELAAASPTSWNYGCYQPADKEWGNPFAWPPTVYGVRTARDGRKNHTGPYLMTSFFRAGPSPVGRKADAFLRYWFHEWVADSSARWHSGAKRATVAQSAQSWRDFFVWAHYQMYKKSRYTGFYFDVSRPVMSDNVYAGAGLSKGKSRVSTWTFLGARRLAKRLYTMLRLELGETDGSIRYHFSGQMPVALLSFADMYIDGENNYSWLTLKKPCYWQHMTLDKFRAQTMGHPIGPVGWWLPQNTRALKKAAKDWASVYPDGGRESRYIVGLVLLHNSALWAAYFPRRYVELMFESMRAYQLSNHRYRFLPYWEHKAVRPAAGLAVSAYRTKAWVAQREGEHKRRAMLVVFNQGAKPLVDATLAVDWKALGFAPDAVVAEGCSGAETPRIDAGRLVLSVGAHDFALVGIRPKP